MHAKLTYKRLATAGLAALVSCAGAAFAQTRLEVAPVEMPATLAAAGSVAGLASPDAPVRRIDLGAPNLAERAQLAALNAVPVSVRLPASADPAKSRPLAIGFSRAVPTDSRNIRLAGLAWQPLPAGGVATRIEVVSAGAAALRLSLAVPDAAPELVVRFASATPSADVHGPYPARAIAEQVARHGAFWSPVIEGDAAVVEIVARAGETRADVALQLDLVSHLVVEPPALASLGPKRVQDIGGSGACNVDVACELPDATLDSAARSVGKLVFSNAAGSTFLCSGTLVNDAVNSYIPYLHTAAHCIEGAFEASTINVYWHFRAQSCRSLAVPPYALQTGGAALLARDPDFDWVLLRLNASPPAGVVFAGWSAALVPTGAAATGLHHPHGDLEKVSRGSTPGYYTFEDGSSFVTMHWRSGTTEAGSSGSGLFTLSASGAYYELRGGLFGGDASCSNRSGTDYYSRFDHMLAATRQYLVPPVVVAPVEVPILSPVGLALLAVLIAARAVLALRRRG
jgi:hypothetical protein